MFFVPGVRNGKQLGKRGLSSTQQVSHKENLGDLVRIVRVLDLAVALAGEHPEHRNRAVDERSDTIGRQADGAETLGHLVQNNSPQRLERRRESAHGLHRLGQVKSS